MGTLLLRPWTGLWVPSCSPCGAGLTDSSLLDAGRIKVAVATGGFGFSSCVLKTLGCDGCRGCTPQWWRFQRIPR
eukprot:142803-Prorocentrum_lima.AAC.1